MWLGCRLGRVGISLRGPVNNYLAAGQSLLVNDFANSVSYNLNEVDASSNNAVWAGKVLHEIKLERPVSEVFVGLTVSVSGETIESASGGILVHGWVAFLVHFFEWIVFGIRRVVAVAVGAD